MLSKFVNQSRQLKELSGSLTVTKKGSHFPKKCYRSSYRSKNVVEVSRTLISKRYYANQTGIDHPFLII